MGLKEKMMEGMMGRMSPEEKREMMEGMMDSFFSGMTSGEKGAMMNDMMERFLSGMTPEEKQGMMRDMMPKMMGSMMGGGDMMGMMGSMMKGMKGMKESGDFNPMEMCRTMMTSMGRSSEMAAYATPELRGLFEEWLGQIESEMLQFIRDNGSADAQKVAEHFKLSKDSAAFCLQRLSQKGKINVKAQPAE